MIKKNTLVRINSDTFQPPTFGRVTSLPRETEDSRYGVTIAGEEWLFTKEELQELTVGTRVLIEAEIQNFDDETMLITGGCMPLSRIVRIVDKE